MARIKTSSADPIYSAMKTDLRSEGDKNFCSVIALAAICKVSVAAAKEALAAEGRQVGRGVYTDIIFKAAERLGYKCVKVGSQYHQGIIASYPKPHNTLQSITTHHPERFAKAWADQPDMLMFSNGHVTAFVDGQVRDWAKGRSKRVFSLYTVEKL
jgi:hypothetical protein